MPLAGTLVQWWCAQYPKSEGRRRGLADATRHQTSHTVYTIGNGSDTTVLCRRRLGRRPPLLGRPVGRQPAQPARLGLLELRLQLRNLRLARSRRDRGVVRGTGGGGRGEIGAAMCASRLLLRLLRVALLQLLRRHLRLLRDLPLVRRLVISRDLAICADLVERRGGEGRRRVALALALGQLALGVGVAALEVEVLVELLRDRGGIAR